MSPNKSPLNNHTQKYRAYTHYKQLINRETSYLRRSRCNSHLTNLPQITTSFRQNRTLFLLKQESNPGEPQPLDNGGYQTAQHSWVQMTHFTRPWSQHMRARESLHTDTHTIPRGRFYHRGAQTPQGTEGSTAV